MDYPYIQEPPGWANSATYYHPHQQQYRPQQRQRGPSSPEFDFRPSQPYQLHFQAEQNDTNNVNPLYRQMPAHPSQSMLPAGPIETPSPPNRAPKRLRATESTSEDETAGAPKHKGPGACARCKGLKVKCEFKTETDPCRRCVNGGWECVQPGKRKRRTPAKREHLMQQIGDQAAQIKELMAQLEKLNTGRPNPSNAAASTSTIGSPSLEEVSEADGTYTPTPEVQDWIKNARQSLESFGGFLNVGGCSAGQGTVEEESESDEDEYGVTVEHPEESYGDRPSILEHRSTSGSSSRKRETMPDTAALPPDVTPFGLMANLSLNKHRRRGSSASADNSAEVGIAREDFFEPPWDLDRQQQAPMILTRGTISPNEAEALFKIYYDSMNPSCSLLDPVLYNAKATAVRSAFLFTVVCAIASRHFGRKDLHAQLMHHAQLAAGTALISGFKNVEACAAFILLALYPIPGRKLEENRSFLFLGVAIRIGQDLNLNRPSTSRALSELHARETLNKTRIWLNCFNLDKSFSSQYGKQSIINPATDYVSAHSEHWYESSEYNMKGFDIHLCAYNEELRVMSKFMGRINSNVDNPTLLDTNADLEKIASEADDELAALQFKWAARLAQTDLTNGHSRFRTALLKLAFSYARLVSLSLGLQHSFGKSAENAQAYFKRCLKAANDVVDSMLDHAKMPGQMLFLRHGPESQSIFLTFASGYLVKSLQPRFSAYMTPELRLEIRGRVGQVIELFEAIAIDENHGPHLYARFLKGLLEAPLSKSPNPSNLPLPRRQSRTHKPTNSSGGSRKVSPETEQNSASPAYSHLSRPSLSPEMSSTSFGGGFTAPSGASSSFPPTPFDYASADMALNMTIADLDFFQHGPQQHLPHSGMAFDPNAGYMASQATAHMVNAQSAPMQDYSTHWMAQLAQADPHNAYPSMDLSSYNLSF